MRYKVRIQPTGGHFDRVVMYATTKKGRKVRAVFVDAHITKAVGIDIELARVNAREALLLLTAELQQ